MDIFYYINNMKKIYVYICKIILICYIFIYYWLSFICNKMFNDNFVGDKYMLFEVVLVYCVYEF